MLWQKGWRTMSEETTFFEGITKISDTVYGTIALLKALEIKGVASMSTTAGDDFANFIGMKSQWEGVKLQHVSDTSITLDLYLVARYGYRIPDVALRVQEHVKTGIETLTGTTVEGVNIFIQDIAFDSTLNASTNEERSDT